MDKAVVYRGIQEGCSYRGAFQKRTTSSDFVSGDRADADAGEKLRVGNARGTRVLAVGPNRRDAAVGVPNSNVIEIDGDGSGLAAGEDDAVFS